MTNNRFNRSKVERYLSLRKREGLTYAALSARTGIPISTLSYWNTKLRRESRKAPSPGFVELVARDPECATPPRPPAILSADASVRVHHPCGAVVELRGQAANVLVDNLLQQVATWS